MPVRSRRLVTARASSLAVLLSLSTACGVAGSGSSTDEPASGSTKPAPSASTPVPTARLTAKPTGTASAALPWGPTRAEWQRAQEIVAGMSAEEKAGQVIVAGYQGTEAPLASLRRHHVGGVIVMGYNVTSADQVRSVNAALRKEAASQGRTWPLLIGVDQEGGTVARVKTPLTEFPTYMTLGAARDPELARKVARASGQELRALGFTMVFAPDADVTAGPSDPTIGSRSAGGDPALVTSIVKGSLRGYADAGILAVPKP